MLGSILPRSQVIQKTQTQMSTRVGSERLHSIMLCCLFYENIVRVKKRWTGNRSSGAHLWSQLLGRLRRENSLEFHPQSRGGGGQNLLMNNKHISANFGEKKSYRLQKAGSYLGTRKPFWRLLHWHCLPFIRTSFYLQQFLIFLLLPHRLRLGQTQVDRIIRTNVAYLSG